MAMWEASNTAVRTSCAVVRNVMYFPYFTCAILGTTLKITFNTFAIIRAVVVRLS